MNDLRRNHSSVRIGNWGKVISALVVASAVSIVSIYGHETGIWKSPHRQIVGSEELPSPAPLPKYVRAMTPPKLNAAPFSL
jgi:hypothetical protein